MKKNIDQDSNLGPERQLRHLNYKVRKEFDSENFLIFKTIFAFSYVEVFFNDTWRVECQNLGSFSRLNFNLYFSSNMSPDFFLRMLIKFKRRRVITFSDEKLCAALRYLHLCVGYI